jgi:hypothetical protein
VSDPLTSGLNDSTSVPFYSDLKQSLADPKFLPEGGTVAFMLVHEYPVLLDISTTNFKKRFHRHLKGADALFYSIAMLLGLKVEMRTVYEIDDSDELDSTIQNLFYDDYEEIEKQEELFLYDEFSPATDSLFTSEKTTYFTGAHNCSEYDTGPIARQIIENCKAYLELPVIWASKKGGDGTWNGAYAAFGNS